MRRDGAVDVQQIMIRVKEVFDRRLVHSSQQHIYLTRSNLLDVAWCTNWLLFCAISTTERQLSFTNESKTKQSKAEIVRKSNKIQTLIHNEAVFWQVITRHCLLISAKHE